MDSNNTTTAEVEVRELDQWASAMAAVEFGLKLADLFDDALRGLLDSLAASLDRLEATRPAAERRI